MLPSAAENEENDLLQTICDMKLRRKRQKAEGYNKRQKPRPASQVELDSYDRMYLRISPLDEG
eukprot:scaffold2593_cov106-Skeletonema_marinoi.AAC.1